jgi:hypothetical protein
VAVVVEVAPAAGLEAVRPEPGPVPAEARQARAKAAVGPVSREPHHPHQKARQAIHNGAAERQARESAPPVPAIPIDLAHAKASYDCVHRGNAPLGSAKRVYPRFGRRF